MAEEKFISLLYPTEESRLFHSDRSNLPNISEDVCYELGLDEIFNLKNGSLSDFFTSDREVIEYRQSALDSADEVIQGETVHQGGSAPSEINGVNVVAFQCLYLSYDRFEIILYPGVACQGVEVAVVTLFLAEGEVDIQSLIHHRT